MKILSIGKFIQLISRGQIESLEDMEGTLVKGLPIHFKRKEKKYRVSEVIFNENKIHFEEIK